MLERTLAVTALLAVVATAGCLGIVDSNPVSPAETTPVETVGACPADVERLDADVAGGEVPQQDAGFAIGADRATVSRGDELTVTLENTAKASRGTGTDHMFVLQRHVDGEWETILGARDGRTGWNATLVMHEPGEGYDWSVSLAEDGFGEWGYEPCGSLPAGKYRFLYHGLVETGEFGSEIPDPAVAVEFSLLEED